MAASTLAFQLDMPGNVSEDRPHEAMDREMPERGKTLYLSGHLMAR